MSESETPVYDVAQSAEIECAGNCKRWPEYEVLKKYFSVKDLTALVAFFSLVYDCQTISEGAGSRFHIKTHWPAPIEAAFFLSYSQAILLMMESEGVGFSFGGKPEILARGDIGGAASEKAHDYGAEMRKRLAGNTEFTHAANCERWPEYAALAQHVPRWQVPALVLFFMNVRLCETLNVAAPGFTFRYVSDWDLPVVQTFLRDFESPLTAMMDAKRLRARFVMRDGSWREVAP